MPRTNSGISQLVCESVQGIFPYVAGRDIEQVKRDYHLSQVDKLASNENPLGVSPKAQAAIANGLTQLSLYPDSNGFALKAALATHHQIKESQITLGNGSNDVLDIIARVFLTQKTNAVYSEHAFAVYKLVTQASGATHKVSQARPAEDAHAPFGHDLDAMLSLVDEQTRVVFIANPNNPTGTYVSSQELKEFLDKLPKTCIAVVDEAYTEYATHQDNYPDATLWLKKYSNLIVTRTFSKAYGLAALRVGYALSNPEIADYLNRVRQPFNVNRLGLLAAEAALADSAHIQKSVAENAAGKALMEDYLHEKGFHFIPSAANFITFHPQTDTSELSETLLKRGIIVRPLHGDGLPKHIRVSIGTTAQVRRFITALEVALRDAHVE